MTYPRSDRELRKSIVKLRALPSEDFDAILASFDDAQRIRVLELLAALEGNADVKTGPNVETDDDQLLLPDDLSPWLAERIRRSSDNVADTAEPFAMTEHARAVLRRCAETLLPQPPRPPKAQAAPSLIERIMRGFA